MRNFPQNFDRRVGDAAFGGRRRALFAILLMCLAGPLISSAGEVNLFISVDNDSVTVNEGETASNSGLVTDADTLTASVGDVFDNGDGTWSWSFDTSDGPDESTTVTVTASNGGESESVQFQLTVNDVPPSVAADAKSVTYNEGETATHDGTFSDPGADTISLFASLGTINDNGDGTWSWAYGPLENSDNGTLVQITAIDEDSVASSTSFTLNVDNVTPTVTADFSVVSTNEGDTVTNSGTYFEPGSDSVTLSASVGDVVDNFDGTWSWSYTPDDGPDDSQTVEIYALDDNGSTGTAIFDLTVNNLPPQISTDNESVFFNEGETATNSGSFFEYGSDSVSLTASLGDVVDNGNGTWSWSYGPLDNIHDSSFVEITATDEDGDSNSVTFNLYVGNIDPTVSAANTSVSVNEGETATNSGTYFENGSDGVLLSASIGDIVDNFDGTWSWSFGTTDGPADSQLVMIFASDNNGGTGSTTFELTVNNLAPTIAVDNPTVVVTEGATATNSGTFSDPGSDIVTLSASIGSMTDNGNGTWSWSFGTTIGSDDSQIVTVTATDSSNEESTATFQLTVNQPPAFTSADATTFTVGSLGSFTVTASGRPTPTIQQSGDLPSGVSFNSSTGELSGTPDPGTGGVYLITFTATNGVNPKPDKNRTNVVGGAVQSFTLTVNEAPAITSADNATFTVGAFGTFTVMATGFPAPTLNNVSPLPAGVTFVDNGDGTATLSGTPDDNAGGTYSLSFTANNAVGSDATQSFTLTVNEAPEFTSVNATTFTVGTAGSFTVTTTGFPAATINRTGDPLPANLSFVDNGDGSATLSGTPAPGTGGVYQFTFAATNGVNGAGEGQVVGATQTFTLTVEEAPSISSANSTSFTVGNFGSFTMTADGYPAPNFSATGTLPNGVTFVNGLLSGTPATGTAGSYSLQVTAANGIGSDDVESFTLTVNDAACVAPVADLIAWYPAEANAIDVKNGHNGTPSGGAGYAAGKVGQAFTFGGASEVVSVPDDIAWDFGAAEFTIQTWVKFNAVSGTDILVAHDEGGGPTNKWIFWLQGGKLGFHLNGPVTVSIASDTAFTPTIGQWYHVAITRSGNTYKFYVDGVQNGADQFDSNAVPAADAPLTIGQAEAILAINGALDEVQIFNRALLASEVLSSYNSSTEGFCVDSLAPASAVSRKTHGAVGDFDVPLPLTGEPGVESRVGATPGDHKIVVTFNNPVTEGSATPTAGTVVGTPTFAGNEMTIDLSGVPNATTLTLSLTSVKDAFGQTLPDATVNMNPLVGDSTGNKTVNASDIGQVKALSGDPTDATKFRCDFNTDGAVNASDVSQVKAASGTRIP